MCNTYVIYIEPQFSNDYNLYENTYKPISGIRVNGSKRLTAYQ